MVHNSSDPLDENLRLSDTALEDGSVVIAMHIPRVRDASPELQNNREFVLSVVVDFPDEIRYASDMMKADRGTFTFVATIKV